MFSRSISVSVSRCCSCWIYISLPSRYFHQITHPTTSNRRNSENPVSRFLNSHLWKNPNAEKSNSPHRSLRDRRILCRHDNQWWLGFLEWYVSYKDFCRGKIETSEKKTRDSGYGRNDVSFVFLSSLTNCLNRNRMGSTESCAKTSLW